MERLASQKAMATIPEGKACQAERESPLPQEPPRVLLPLPQSQPRPGARHRTSLEAAATLSEGGGLRCP
jgi:hypothetical protein